MTSNRYFQRLRKGYPNHLIIISNLHLFSISIFLGGNLLEAREDKIIQRGSKCKGDNFTEARQQIIYKNFSPFLVANLIFIQSSIHATCVAPIYIMGKIKYPLQCFQSSNTPNTMLLGKFTHSPENAEGYRTICMSKGIYWVTFSISIF